MKRALGVLLAILCGACNRHGAAAAGFELRDVCSAKIAELEAGLPRVAAPALPDAEHVEQIRELVNEYSRAQGLMKSAYLQDAVAQGEGVVAVLDAWLDEQDLAADLQLAALEILGAIDSPSSAAALVKRVNLEKYHAAWLRAQAAFQLTKQSSDNALLPLIAQLKYETDGETVIWMAAALAKHRNYAAFEGLRVLSAGASNAEVRANAAAMMSRLAQEAGFADGEALFAAWVGTDVEHALPEEQPSPALRLEVWRRIAWLAQFDLRIVDDARFALSRSATWVVEPLSSALHENDLHIRLHAAQCIERMGPRARAACTELAHMLDEPHAAAAAAQTLGAIRCTDALDALAKRLEPDVDPELRNAAATALGRLGASAAGAPLRGLLATDEPLDLRQAAAQSLLELGDDRPSVALLIECLTAPAADCGAAENALEQWLNRRAGTSDSGAVETLQRWRAISADSAETPPPEQVARRRRQRAELLRGLEN